MTERRDVTGRWPRDACAAIARLLDRLDEVRNETREEVYQASQAAECRARNEIERARQESRARTSHAERAREEAESALSRERRLARRAEEDREWCRLTRRPR